MENKEFDFIIIGAGVCGSIITHVLARHSISHLLLEKSKGVGGRVASRRVNDLIFNHGLNQFKLNSKQQKIFDLYFNKSDFEPPATNAIKKLLVGCHLNKNLKVAQINKNDSFQVVSENGESFNSKYLIITTPAPQALDLIKSLGLDELNQQLATVQYSKRIILFSDQGDRGSSMQLMDDLFSEEYFEESDDFILNLNESKGFNSVKKWRYEKVNLGLANHFLGKSNLFLVGDYFGAPLNRVLDLHLKAQILY